MNVYQTLDLLLTQQIHLTMEYLNPYETYLIHQKKMSLLFKIPFLQLKRFLKCLKNYLKMVTDTSHLT